MTSVGVRLIIAPIYGGLCGRVRRPHSNPLRIGYLPPHAWEVVGSLWDASLMDDGLAELYS